MKNPLITMSAITGNPSFEDVFDYMNALNQNGIEQILIYPRSGCEIEYLSDEWFEKVGYFIDVAKKLDMYIWLYDDFNWPSGHAGGLVTKNEKFRLKSIFVKGENKGKISTASTHGGSLFDEKYFPDLLSGEAVDYFISCTHEKYYERFSEYFGTLIKGFFTDEAATAYCCTNESVPYYNGIEEDYAQRFRRSFQENLHNECAEFYENLTELIGERFNKCFVTKIRQWCEEHNILLTGHLMEDTMPDGATRQSGDFLKNLSSFSVPGIDEVSTDLTFPWLLALLGGTEYSCGENGAMAELFALGPCDMSYTTKKCMIYLTSCFKIDHYFLAIAPLDVRGNKYIKDFFSNFTADQPDFGGMRLLAKDASKAAIYAKKDFVPDVYIRYPKTICARHRLDDLNVNPFCEIVNKLSFYQMQWKFLNSDDDSNSIPVIEFSDAMEYVLNGVVTTDAEEICSMLTKHIMVTDYNGELPCGIFVRKFNDDSFVVVNIYGNAGVYKIQGKDIYLEKQAVFTDADFKKYINVEKRQAITQEFQLCYGGTNMIRAMYINDENDFEICTDVDRKVRFAVRNDISAYINGEEIICEKVPNELMAGFKKLYRISSEIHLKKGKNVVKAGKDYKYLPSVFALGDFKAQVHSDKVCGVTMCERKTNYVPGNRFGDFGEVAFSTELFVPKGAKAIEIKGSKLFTALCINDNLIDKKICAPYIFNVNENLQGKYIKLKITQYSSLGPVFGDVGYFHKHSDDVSWDVNVFPELDVFGFEELNFIY